MNHKIQRMRGKVYHLSSVERSEEVGISHDVTSERRIDTSSHRSSMERQT